MQDRDGDRLKTGLTRSLRTAAGLIPLITILGLGFTARYVAMVEKGLWYDELQSVTHASLPIPDLLTSVRLFDPHPPLYYLLLHYWLKLGTSDLWIKSSSVLVLLLAIISLYTIAKKYYNDRTAILAALLFAISPYAVNYGSEARNYALWMLLVLWIYEFNYQLLTTPKQNLSAVAFCVTTISFLYLHGISFLVLPAIYLQALILLIHKKVSWKSIKIWGLIQVLIIVAYIPWLQRAWTIGNVTPSVVPILPDIITTLYFHILGYCASCPLWLQAVIVFAWISICIHLLISKSTTHVVILAYTFGPILAAILISYVIRPIWLFRGLGLIVPFILLEIAIWIDLLFTQKKVPRFAAGAITVAVILLFSIALVNQIRSLVYPWDFKQASLFVKINARAEEVIYIPSERMFWCWNWYFLGPGQTNPIRSDYVAQTTNKITIISKPAWMEPPEDHGFWQIYREIDTPLVDSTNISKQEWDFEGLKVEYIPSEKPR